MTDLSSFIYKNLAQINIFNNLFLRYLAAINPSHLKIFLFLNLTSLIKLILM